MSFKYTTGYRDGFALSGPDSRCADVVSVIDATVGEGAFGNFLLMTDERLEQFTEALNYIRSLVAMGKINLVWKGGAREVFIDQRNGYCMEKEPDDENL